MPPLVSMQLRKDDLSLTFFSMITTLGTPRDVTLQQLKIECFFPADAATETAGPRGWPRPVPSPIAVVTSHYFVVRLWVIASLDSDLARMGNRS